MVRANADVEFTQEANPTTGQQQDCVYVECCESGNSFGPVWGHGIASVRRALAELSKNCDCGSEYHAASGGEDQDD